MMTVDVATTRKSTTRRPKPAAAATFAEVGRVAARDAQRALLLETCERLGWHLGAVAEALAMGAASHVVRALKNLAPDEYEAARESGKVSQANRRE